MLYFAFTIIFVLRVRILKNGELRLFPQGHDYRQRQDLSPGIFIPSPGVFILDQAAHLKCDHEEQRITKFFKLKLTYSLLY